MNRWTTFLLIGLSLIQGCAGKRPLEIKGPVVVIDSLYCHVTVRIPGCDVSVSPPTHCGHPVIAYQRGCEVIELSPKEKP